MYDPNDPYGLKRMEMMRQQLAMQSNAGYQQSSTNMEWVQGLEGAKGDQLPLGYNKVMFDSENEGVFYIKSRDAAGMYKPLRKFLYKEVDAPTPAGSIDTSQFVRRDELQSLILDMLSAKEVTQNEQSVSANDRPQQRRAETKQKQGISE